MSLECYTQEVSGSKKMSTTIVLFWTGIVFILLMAGVLALFWNSLPPQLPWFYSLPWGESQLVGKIWFVWIFLGMIVTMIITRLIANWAGKNDTTVQSTIMIGGLVTVILMMASFSRVMMIFLIR